MFEVPRNAATVQTLLAYQVAASAYERLKKDVRILRERKIHLLKIIDRYVSVSMIHFRSWTS